jgi:hypothetical protein
MSMMWSREKKRKAIVEEDEGWPMTPPAERDAAFWQLYDAEKVSLERRTYQSSLPVTPPPAASPASISREIQLGRWDLWDHNRCSAEAIDGTPPPAASPATIRREIQLGRWDLWDHNRCSAEAIDGTSPIKISYGVSDEETFASSTFAARNLLRSTWNLHSKKCFAREIPRSDSEEDVAPEAEGAESDFDLETREEYDTSKVNDEGEGNEAEDSWDAPPPTTAASCNAPYPDSSPETRLCTEFQVFVLQTQPTTSSDSDEDTAPATTAKKPKTN